MKRQLRRHEPAADDHDAAFQPFGLLVGGHRVEHLGRVDALDGRHHQVGAARHYEGVGPHPFRVGGVGTSVPSRTSICGSRATSISCWSGSRSTSFLNGTRASQRRTPPRRPSRSHSATWVPPFGRDQRGLHAADAAAHDQHLLGLLRRRHRELRVHFPSAFRIDGAVRLAVAHLVREAGTAPERTAAFRPRARSAPSGGSRGRPMGSRASSTTSACPEASISSMSAGSDSAPSVATGVATCFLMAAAYGTLQPSSMNMLGCVHPGTPLRRPRGCPPRRG